MSQIIKGYWHGPTNDCFDPLSENLIKHMLYDHSFNNIITNETPTINGAVTLVPGKIKKAAQFSGTNAYASYSAYNLTTGKEITAAAWVYLISRGSYDAIVGARSNANDMNWFIDAEGSVFKFYTAAATSYPFGSNITIGQWYHVAASVDSNRKLSMYINGTLAATQNNIPLSVAQPPLLMTGNLYPGFSLCGNSIVDDIRIYDAAKPAAFINKIYKKGNP